ncbi:deubiquitinase OTUD6B-like [Diadema antillarum]|uniref:deubiquitinase OTUD6B-like n=1 Tax=Diadema antillarum TaxID=105358 RepID=UPI003A888F2D
MDLEFIEQKHRKEKKELQAKIQGIKKAVPKGDKKRKREATEEIARLEAELEQRHQTELAAHHAESGAETGAENNQSQNENPEDLLERLDISDTAEEKPQKISKAQKRRNKKAQEEKERADRIAEAEKDNVNSARNKETKQFAAIMTEKNMRIKQIPSDGHCLYNAVVHQLLIQGIEETMLNLRQRVSDHMRANLEEFLCFLTKPDTGDVFTPEEYEKYCDDIAHTAAWGGHHEMKAIAELYKKPIQVWQAEGPALTIGEQFDAEEPIMLSYHRHEFGLGEHYNSVVKKETSPTEDKR